MKRNRLGPDRIREMERVFGDLLETVGEDPQREGPAENSRRAPRVPSSFSPLAIANRRGSGEWRDLRFGCERDRSGQGHRALFDVRTSFAAVHRARHVAYIPHGKVIGLSKIARIVDVFARRFQIQEQSHHSGGGCAHAALHPSGVAVVIEAKHLCMMMRGVEKQNSVMKTSCLLGVFKEDATTRSEFLALLK